jgi:hypothetical protein
MIGEMWHLCCSVRSHGTPSIKPKKIPIPDVPPPNHRESEAGLFIAGIGILCASVVIAAMLFVFSAREEAKAHRLLVRKSNSVARLKVELSYS